MKAEHRKELLTNTLADQMGKFIKGTSSMSGTVWVLLGLIVVVGVAYWWWTGLAANRIASAWIDYSDGRQSADRLEEVINQWKGTAAERAAKLTRADHLYEKGYEALFTAKGPQGALPHFQAAAQIYEQLSQDPGNSREVAVRALVGAAKAHESLASLGQKESLDKAKSLYQQLLKQYGQEPRSPLVQEAEKRLALLDGPSGSDALTFYKEWPARLAKIEASGQTPDSTPGPPAEK